MRSISILILIFFPYLHSFSQEKMFQKWDKAVLEKANTGKDVDKLSEEEKTVILFCNMARMEPKLFIETVLKYYTDSVGNASSASVLSLKKDLHALKKEDPFLVQEDLILLSKEHAVKMDRSGKKGHEGFSARYKVVMKKYTKGVAENCSYGQNKALNIAMQLLIDEGVTGSGHRKNILEPNFTSVGVCIYKHKTAKWQCVMGFGGE